MVSLFLNTFLILLFILWPVFNFVLFYIEDVWSILNVFLKHFKLKPTTILTSFSFENMNAKFSNQIIKLLDKVPVYFKVRLGFFFLFFCFPASGVGIKNSSTPLNYLRFYFILPSVKSLGNYITLSIQIFSKSIKTLYYHFPRKKTFNNNILKELFFLILNSKISLFTIGNGISFQKDLIIRIKIKIWRRKKKKMIKYT